MYWNNSATQTTRYMKDDTLLIKSPAKVTNIILDQGTSSGEDYELYFLK